MVSPDHSLRFSDEFDAPVATVFELFTDLTRIHLWTAGMLPVTEAPRMVEGLTYTAHNVTAGKPSHSQVSVTELVPQKRVRLVNSGGVISYDAVVLFAETSPGRASITCEMSFTLSAGLLEEAQPVIQAMAEARIRGNWEVFKTLLLQHSPASKPR